MNVLLDVANNKRDELYSVRICQLASAKNDLTDITTSMTVERSSVTLWPSKSCSLVRGERVG